MRQTPLYDRTAIPQEWTDRWRLTIADLFCGRGGVGRAIAGGGIPIESHLHAGFDIRDFSEEYPGRFGQIDLLDGVTPEDLATCLDMEMSSGYGSVWVDRATIEAPDKLPSSHGLTADVVWASFPCAAYSSLSPTYYGSQEAALEANPRITDEFRELLLEIAPHYVIENVPRATKVGDLKANVRVNGLAFGLPFDLERHFETTFECPDAYCDGDPDVAIDTRNDQSVQELAAAKGVPSAWGKSDVRSAIPTAYVEWILGHCPAFPTAVPKPKNVLTGYGDVGAYERWVWNE